MRMETQLAAEAGAEAGPVRAAVLQRVLEVLALVPIMIGVQVFLTQALDDDHVLGEMSPSKLLRPPPTHS